MKIGLQIPSYSGPGGAAAIAPRLAELAATADEAGLASLWVMDHWFQIPLVGEAELPMLEGYAALAFAAAHTRRIRLGTLVTGVTYRHPGLLVKTATTLDVLSGGRAWLGIGAGWFEREHDGLGVPFPPRAERFERLEETLEIARRMRRDDASPFQGHHYQLAEPLNRPQPLSQPRLPILIGGLGERKTLRLVARYADAWNGFDYVGIAELARKRDVLRAHCDAEGRDFAEIECTSLGTLQLGARGAGVKEAVEHLGQLAEAGFPHAIVNLTDVHERAPLETLVREVLPEVTGL